MKDEYSYPAILYYDDDGIAIEFPDLPGCLPCAHNTEEALKNAAEALGLHLFGLEQDGDEIPTPTPLENIEVEGNAKIVIVDVFMPPVRASINKK